MCDCYFIEIKYVLCVHLLVCLLCLYSVFYFGQGGCNVKHFIIVYDTGWIWLSYLYHFLATFDTLSKMDHIIFQRRFQVVVSLQWCIKSSPTCACKIKVKRSLSHYDNWKLPKSTRLCLRVSAIEKNKETVFLKFC